MNRHSIRRTATGQRFGLLLIAVLLAGAAAGCSSPAPVKGADAGLVLQSQVLAVTEAAAANDPDGTLKLLDELAAKVDQTAMAGDITFQRHQTIMAAINALRTELAAHLPVSSGTATPAPAAVPAEADQTAAADPGVPDAVVHAPISAWTADTAPIETAPAPPIVQAPVVQAPAAPSPAPAVHGKGSDKGNGKN